MKRLPNGWIWSPLRPHSRWYWQDIPRHEWEAPLQELV